MSLFIGALSGTSMDGIDIALVDCSKHKIIEAKTYPYTESLLMQVQKACVSTSLSAYDIAYLDQQLGMAFAQAINTFIETYAIDPDIIQAIGCHGQTVVHAPDAETPISLQLGCGQTIAYLTGLKVVNDFRKSDTVAGGQGAPLAPLYHHEIFKNKVDSFATVNIGGISNICFFSNDSIHSGYDTGPGNGLMDAWISKYKGFSFDKNGQWAREGKSNELLLSVLLDDPYFAKPYPKSLDKHHFNIGWLDEKIEKNMYEPIDIQSTLCHFTAKTIAGEILKAPFNLNSIILCGGGAHNTFLVELLQHYCQGLDIVTSDQLSISADYLEAMLFAWLAQQRLQHRKFDMQSLTGSSGQRLLGTIYEP